MITSVNRRNRTSGRRPDTSPQSGYATIKAFETELGWMAIAWREDVLVGIVFGHATKRTAEFAIGRSLQLAKLQARIATADNTRTKPKWVNKLTDGLLRFAMGEPVDFSDVPIAADHLTTFGRRVVAACRRIRWGQTRSYGELASACEAPGAARAVGTVMAKNRYPLVVPCHRVLAAGGALGGYSAPDGLRMKRRLLAMEQR